MNIKIGDRAQAKLVLILLAISGLITSHAQEVFVEAAGVNLAQTHVLNADGALGPNGGVQPGLIGHRDALFKVNFVANTENVGVNRVNAWLTLFNASGASESFALIGPRNLATLPTTFDDTPVNVKHSFDDSHTTVIPGQWVEPGLRWQLNWVVLDGAGQAIASHNQRSQVLDVGLPNTMKLNIIDIQWFDAQTPLRDFPIDLFEEMQQKLPVQELQIRRARDGNIFTHIALPYRADNSNTANVNELRMPRIVDLATYQGDNYDTDVSRSSRWASVLQKAAGRNYYEVADFCVINHGSVASGGVGTDGYFCSSQDDKGVFWHEFGHSLMLRHWGVGNEYPYKDPDTFGGQDGPITYDSYLGLSTGWRYRKTHVGPYWAFDARNNGTLISPWVDSNNDGTPDRWKSSPMQGGGTVDAAPGFSLAHLSDYSVKKITSVLNNKMVWLEEDNSWLDDQTWQSNGAGWYHRNNNGYVPVNSDGSGRPINADHGVYSIMIAGSMASNGNAEPFVHIYPPIGPYESNVRKLYDPRTIERTHLTNAGVCPPADCDLSLRVVQGGVERVYALEVAWDPSRLYSDATSFFEYAINVPAGDGAITYAEVLSTPNLTADGFSVSPPMATYEETADLDGDGILDVEEFPGCENDPNPDCARIRGEVQHIYSQIMLESFSGSEPAITAGYEFLRDDEGNCYDLVADVAESSYNNPDEFYELCDGDLGSRAADVLVELCPDGLSDCRYGRNHWQMIWFENLGVTITAGGGAWRRWTGVGADVSPNDAICYDQTGSDFTNCFNDQGTVNPETMVLTAPGYEPSDHPSHVFTHALYRSTLSGQPASLAWTVPVALNPSVFESEMPDPEQIGIVMAESGCVSSFANPTPWSMDASDSHCLTDVYLENDPTGEVHGIDNIELTRQLDIIHTQHGLYGINICVATVPRNGIERYVSGETSTPPGLTEDDLVYDCNINGTDFDYLQSWLGRNDVYDESVRQMYTSLFVDAVTLGVGAASARVGAMAARTGSTGLANIARILRGVEVAHEVALIVAESYVAAEDFKACRASGDQTGRHVCQAAALGNVFVSLLTADLDVPSKKGILSELIPPGAGDAFSKNEIDGLFVKAQREYYRRTGTGPTDSNVDSAALQAQRLDEFKNRIEAMRTDVADRTQAGTELTVEELAAIRDNLNSEIDEFLADYNIVWGNDHPGLRNWADELKTGVDTMPDQVFLNDGFWSRLDERLEAAGTSGFDEATRNSVTDLVRDMSALVNALDLDTFPDSAFSDIEFTRILNFLHDHPNLTLDQKRNSLTEMGTQYLAYRAQSCAR